jgi:hypothetical protein
MTDWFSALVFKLVPPTTLSVWDRRAMVPVPVSAPVFNVVARATEPAESI